jgi:two-component system CheB/CheR fusion protein
MVRDTPSEAQALANDLMLSVTRFFRDPDSFEVLQREVLVPLVRDADGLRPLRVWVPGCATGEEAYTIAMLAAESAPPGGQAPSVRIFATDIDERALEAARAGRYPGSIAADVAPERLARFFVADGTEFVVRKELREQIVFARHNALADPPFSQLDLISCRNMLIYTEGQAQRRLAGLFHFALNPGGVLFLGSAETPASGTQLFEPVSAKHRLYRRLGTARGRAAATDGVRTLDASTQTRIVAATEGRTPAEIMRQALLAEFAPPSVLVDGRGHALYFHGQTGDILDIGEIPGLHPVAEKLDRLAAANPLGKPEGAHIGSAGWTVNGEISQNGDIDAVKMVPGARQGFRGEFGGGVGGNRIGHIGCFDEWHFRSGVKR